MTDEVLIHLIMLPLTYKGTEKNQTAIKECVRLARQIPDKNQETFAPVYISVQRIICPRSIYSFTFVKSSDGYKIPSVEQDLGYAEKPK